MNRIINRLIRYLMLLKIILQSIFYHNKIYIFGTPIHGNLGDQAILISEIKLIQDNLKSKKIIEIESNVVSKYINIIKRFIDETTIICIHGGGFLGTLWLNEERMARTVISNFPNNKIVIFPQTAFFSDDEEGNVELLKSKSIYETHKNLHICLREKYSYEYMKEKFPKCHIYLVPDMVLYLDKVEKKQNMIGDVVLCLRGDKEKVFSARKELEEKLNFLGYDKIINTDTVIPQNLYSFNRKSAVYKKINDFSKSKLIVTDRLHGMVFAYLAKTPCLVILSKSHKVKGVYEWIKKDKRIRIHDEKNKIEEEIKSIMNYNFEVDCELDFQLMIDLLK